MIGLVIKDFFTLRKKILMMLISMGIGDIVLLIATAILKANSKGADFFFPLRVQKWFKGGVMCVSLVGIAMVFMMVNVIEKDKDSSWNKLVMAFPVSSWSKSLARFSSLSIIALFGGLMQYAVTMIMFNILGYELSIGTLKYVYAPFAIGLTLILLRTMFEYIFGAAVAIEYTGIVAVFFLATCFIIYKFGDIAFPKSKSEIIKMFLHHIDRALLLIIPVVFIAGVCVVALKMGKRRR